ncbi:MAG: competence/damage-inducible protein A [Thermodesulfobacteriota bacterium]
MSVEIITTGNEIMAGLTLDTNFNWAAGVLSEKGISVLYHSSVSDNVDDLISSFETAAKRAKAVIVIGGLGPTDDDLSAISASKFLSSNLVFNQMVYDSIVEKLKNRGRKPNENHKKQAKFPEISKVIENPLGTAFGFKFKFSEAVFYFLPGVPKEFKMMFLESVLPEIEKSISKNKIVLTRLLKTFGLGESEVAKKLSGIELGEVELGYRIKFPEVHLRLSAAGSNETELKRRLAASTNLISKKLGDYLFSTNDKSLEEAAAEMLFKKNITVATAESCTGGLLASRLTDVPGSSAYFLEGVVAYSNESKVQMLGVSKSDIDKFGAVSSEAAMQMAKGIRELSGSDIGIGISGIAGPGGGTREKPVGTVFIGLNYKDSRIFSKKYRFHGTRSEIKTLAASTALDLVRKFCLYDV